jgi:hypothetical protein
MWHKKDLKVLKRLLDDFPESSRAFLTKYLECIEETALDDDGDDTDGAD